jgi:hypothetical protein
MARRCGRRRRKTRRPAHRRLTVVGAFMLGGAVLSLSACGSVSPVAKPAVPTTSTSPPPTGPTAVALTAYRDMWADMVKASQTSNDQSPLLPEHASEDALSLLVHGLYLNGLQGIVTKGQPVLHPQVTSLSPATDPTQATIADCFDDTHWLEYRTSGGLLNKVPGGHHATMAVVQDDGGVWKVSALVVQAAGTC